MEWKLCESSPCNGKRRKRKRSCLQTSAEETFLLPAIISRISPRTHLLLFRQSLLLLRLLIYVSSDTSSQLRLHSRACAGCPTGTRQHTLTPLLHADPHVQYLQKYRRPETTDAPGTCRAESRRWPGRIHACNKSESHWQNSGCLFPVRPRPNR